MSTKTATKQPPHNVPSENPLGPKKTLFVLVIVVGCIAILWPRIFHPMLFSTPNAPPVDNFVEKKIPRPGGEYNKIQKIFLQNFLFGSMKNVTKENGRGNLKIESVKHEMEK